MAVLLLLLAAVIAVVNGRPDLMNGNPSLTTQCQITIQVIYPPAGLLPYPTCTSTCPDGDEQLWIDGIVFKRFAALSVMVEMTYSRGSVQSCKMVPYQTDEELIAAEEKTKCQESSLQNEVASQEEVEAVIPSVTELIPTSISRSINKQLQGFTKLGSSLYMTSPTTMTWHEADRFCKQNNAALAFIESAQEQNNLKGVLANDFWFGLHDLVAEGIFTNQNNTPITYSNWKNGEPNSKRGHEDCGMLFGRQQSLWNDENCRTKNYALCEQPLVEDPYEYKCPEGYRQFKSSCYVMSATAETYTTGTHFCSAKGGYPVFINSQEEHDFVVGMTSSHAFIGYTDSQTEGTFASSKFGLPLFKRWNRGEPNNKQNSEDCIIIEPRFQYLWNDSNCDHKSWIICERPAEVVD